VAALIKEETKLFAFKHCDNMSLVLTLRDSYLKKVAESFKIKQLEFDFFGEKVEQHVQQFKHIISRSP
jgi:hypothetical protein